MQGSGEDDSGDGAEVELPAMCPRVNARVVGHAEEEEEEEAMEEELVGHRLWVCGQRPAALTKLNCGCADRLSMKGQEDRVSDGPFAFVACGSEGAVRDEG